jgi:hypothetical protein
MPAGVEIDVDAFRMVHPPQLGHKLLSLIRGDQCIRAVWNSQELP